jgi:hypothetical protein
MITFYLAWAAAVYAIIAIISAVILFVEFEYSSRTPTLKDVFRIVAFVTPFVISLAIGVWGTVFLINYYK